MGVKYEHINNLEETGKSRPTLRYARMCVRRVTYDVGIIHEAQSVE